MANMKQQEEPPVVQVEPPVVHVALEGYGHGRIRCDKDKLGLEKVKFMPDDPMNPKIYADFMTNLRTQEATAASIEGPGMMDAIAKVTTAAFE